MVALIRLPKLHVLPFLSQTPGLKEQILGRCLPLDDFEIPPLSYMKRVVCVQSLRHFHAICWQVRLLISYSARESNAGVRGVGREERLK
jgi:hypothetical protein